MTDLEELLEDFGACSPGLEAAPLPAISESELEGQKLESFEKGYRAGWDDAIKAQGDESKRISSALGQHLQDLSFTYHEAYNNIMTSVTPLLNELVESVLPALARATLGQHIAEQLEQISRDSAGLLVEIAVNPSKRDAVAPLLEQDFGFPLSLVTDDTLSEEQADLRFNGQEKQIDLGDLIASVTEAVEGFAHDNQRKRDHG